MSDLRLIGLKRSESKTNSRIIYSKWVSRLDSTSGEILLEFEINPEVADPLAEPSEINIIIKGDEIRKTSLTSGLVSVSFDMSNAANPMLRESPPGTRSGWIQIDDAFLSHPSKAFRVEVLPSLDRKGITAIKLLRGS